MYGKIIHVDLNSYSSLEELIQAFLDMPDEMKVNGVQLADSKQKAEDKLRYTYQIRPSRPVRVFWWEQVDTEEFTMYECLIS